MSDRDRPRSSASASSMSSASSVSAWLGSALLLGLIGLAVVVPWLTPDPDAVDYADKLAAPGPDHLLGTDQAGRDLLARLAAGARISLGSALLVGVIGFGVGLMVGSVAAVSGGVVDTILTRIVDIAMAIPQLVLALAVVGVLGPGLGNLVFAMAVAGWAPMARYARRFTLDRLSDPYVVAARMVGVGRWRVAIRHVTPSAGLRLLAVGTLGLGEIVLGLSALSFLGLGPAPPTAEWGRMVAESHVYAGQAPWLVLAPGAAVVAVVGCAALLSDALEERMERLR